MIMEILDTYTENGMEVLSGEDAKDLRESLKVVVVRYSDDFMSDQDRKLERWPSGQFLNKWIMRARKMLYDKYPNAKEVIALPDIVALVLIKDIDSFDMLLSERIEYLRKAAKEDEEPEIPKGSLWSFYEFMEGVTSRPSLTLSTNSEIMARWKNVSIQFCEDRTMLFVCTGDGFNYGQSTDVKKLRKLTEEMEPEKND